MTGAEANRGHPGEPSGAIRDGNGERAILPAGPVRDVIVAGQPVTEAFGRTPKLPEAFGRGEIKARKKEDDQKTDDEKKKEDQPADDKGEDKADDKKDDPSVQKDNKPKKPPLYKRPVPMIIISSILLVLVIVGVIWWLHARQFESTDDAFIDGHIIPISPNVAAYVKNVYIDDNWHVKKGDLLVELDPSDYQVIVDQMKANLSAASDKLAQAKTQVDVSKANIGQAEAEVVVAKTNAENAERDYDRFTKLDERSRSQQQLDNALAAKKSAEAQVEQAKAKLAAAQASAADAQVAIKTASANVERAGADLHQAEINLGYCQLTAPEEGIVTRKNVEPGAYLQKGDPIFSIVPTNVWVTANYKETQLDLMRPGQPVTIKVDAYPDKEFHGKVNSIQNGTGSKFSLLPAENATGNYVKIVQRVPVKILFDPGETNDKDHPLALGMSVDPKVKIR